MTQRGEIMRDVLREFHAMSGYQFAGPMYVTNAMYSEYSWPLDGFILRPFGEYTRIYHSYLAQRSHDNLYWIFMELPE